MSAQQLFEVRVHAITAAAEGVHLFELRPAKGVLPAFGPGAHVDLHLPNGLLRSYSLVNDASERHRYVIGVAREQAGRGGSAWLHDTLRVGDRLSIAPPRNHFVLDESAPRSVLVGGGIGITPLWCMAQRLEHLGRSWAVHYAARNLGGAALVEELEALAAASRIGRLYLHVGRRPGDARMDLVGIVAAAPAGTHFYCCGPATLLEAFRTACSSLPDAQVHFEYFAPVDEASIVHDGFTVVLARSNKSVPIGRDETILAALRRADVSVPSSCEQGICGACETAVLEGVPEHRDLILSAKEQASNKVVMICCSGARTPTLVLDL